MTTDRRDGTDKGSGDWLAALLLLTRGHEGSSKSTRRDWGNYKATFDTRRRRRRSVLLLFYLLRVELPLHHLHEVFVWHRDGHVHLPAVRAFMHRAAVVLQVDGWTKRENRIIINSDGGFPAHHSVDQQLWWFITRLVGNSTVRVDRVALKEASGGKLRNLSEISRETRVSSKNPYQSMGQFCSLQFYVTVAVCSHLKQLCCFLLKILYWSFDCAQFFIFQQTTQWISTWSSHFLLQS